MQRTSGERRGILAAFTSAGSMGFDLRAAPARREKNWDGLTDKKWKKKRRRERMARASRRANR